jgi:exodeoxyribonuclease VII small subunit
MPATTKSYGELSSELDDVLLQLEAESLDVDTAVKLYERGLQLVSELEKHLETAENKIRELKAKAG